jgi:hypothetical protein
MMGAVIQDGIERAFEGLCGLLDDLVGNEKVT